MVELHVKYLALTIMDSLQKRLSSGGYVDLPIWNNPLLAQIKQPPGLPPTGKWKYFKGKLLPNACHNYCALKEISVTRLTTCTVISEAANKRGEPFISTDKHQWTYSRTNMSRVSLKKHTLLTAGNQCWLYHSVRCCKEVSGWSEIL